MQYLAAENIDGYVADNRFRQRDPRFHDVDKYKMRHRQEQGAAGQPLAGTKEPSP